MKNQFIFIFSVTLFLIVMVGSCSFLIHRVAVVKEPDLERPEESAEQEKVQNSEESSPVSYKFIGQVDGITETPPQTDEKEMIEIEENPEAEGEIPELTIQLNGMDIEQIADHYRYVLALMTEDRILGIIDKGALKQIDSEYLNNYASRARAADIPPDIKSLVSRLQKMIDQRIRAIYLVPNQIEEQFIQVQLQAIRKAGLTPGEVELVTARYLGDYSIEVINIES